MDWVWYLFSFEGRISRQQFWLGYVLAIAELVDQMPPPDVIVHSTSSGGTQAGLVGGHT